MKKARKNIYDVFTFYERWKGEKKEMYLQSAQV